jgi:hypothetical protein
MTHVTDFAYCLEEYEVPLYPGIMIMHAWLNISIQRVNGDLSYTIDSIELEKPDSKSCESFEKGSFIYDAIVPYLYENEKISASIMSEANDHM